MVVSVGYRLAPEHKFPTAIEDGYAALLWVAKHVDALGINVEQLTVGGQSAGGGIAAALTLLARDRNGPALAAQILEVPAVALALLGAMRDQHLDAPTHLAVIGVDDIPLAALSTPALSTVAMDLSAAAHTVCAIVIDMMNSASTDVRRAVTSPGLTVIARATT